ncbi:aspartate/glutamate racemase family protein [Photobacterium leiognathi]|uniref:aspartate/glutamate racemase family protein n=1 Tax=Photobacterium leiognathi TaxID=553611 RepID=UPI00298142C0|nr:aspartate/glutamate racemase family protein [Photobacterium leiognathi]
MERTRVGIIGGMGNEAMADLLEKMATVEVHQQREFVAFGNARLAYRPEEVGTQWQPTDLPELRKYDTALYTLRLMQYLGAETVGLACNSAHELFRQLVPALPFNFVDMIKQTAESLSDTQDIVLVMGVDSLVNSGLYQSALLEYGIAATKPSIVNQRKVMDAIYHSEYGIKTAKITQQAEQLLCDVICDEVAQQGCKKVVLGCTELPLALTAESCDRFKQQGLLPEELEIIDASMVLAQSLMSQTGQSAALPEPLLNYQRPNLDWFTPVCFKVDSLSEMAEIQHMIFAMSAAHLALKGQCITGSYSHLPTLFFSSNASDIEQKLTAIDIPVYGSEILSSGVIDSIFDQYYR